MHANNGVGVGSLTCGFGAKVVSFSFSVIQFNNGCEGWGWMRCEDIFVCKGFVQAGDDYHRFLTSKD